MNKSRVRTVFNYLTFFDAQRILNLKVVKRAAALLFGEYYHTSHLKKRIKALGRFELYKIVQINLGC